ncbi:MAG TPA: hypothetical protein VK861_10225 [Bacteroidales bacterium]|nr:hypothetical protein [Bacteroidales bacterium]
MGKRRVDAVKSAGVVEKGLDLSAEHPNETTLLVVDESILKMTTMMLMTDAVMPEMDGRELAGNLLSHYPDLK